MFIIQKNLEGFCVKLEENLFSDFYVNYKIENKELNLIATGRHINTPNRSYFHQKRNTFIIHYILKGKGTFHYQNTSVELSEQDLFIMYPGYEYFYEADAENPWDYIWVEFIGNNAEHIVSQTPFSVTVPYIHSEEDLSCYLQNIVAHKGFLFTDQISMLGYLYVFLGKITPKNVENKDEIYLEKAFSYVSKHYSEKITVDKLAKQLNISRDYLYKIFMNNLKYSPSSYIIKYRINESLFLLSNTSLSIGKISETVGFYDQFHFSKTFKKHMMMTPLEYRKKMSEPFIVDKSEK